MVLLDGKYSCIGIRTQLTRLLGKHASVEPPRHTHTHTHTYSHTLTQWLSHSHRFAYWMITEVDLKKEIETE